MKAFATPEGKSSAPEISKDFENAQKFDTIKLGELGVYFSEGFKTRFIPYNYIHRAFIRINEVNGRMCCGTATFAYYRIVFVHDGKEIADVISEKEKLFDQALEIIASHGVTTGFNAQA